MNKREIIKAIGFSAAFGLLNFSGILPVRSVPYKILKMKTIGVLGGLGPQATIDFESRIHHVAQRLIDPSQNAGYPPMIVYYHRNAPVLLNEDQSPVLPIQPDPVLLNAAKNLGAVSDFLVIPSNGVHIIQKEIEQASGRRVLSMIDATLEEIKRRQWKKVGVVGFKSVMVYAQRLEQMGIIVETIDKALQVQLDETITRVMEGRNDQQDVKFVLEIVKLFRKRKVDGFIPGCTEIPLLLKGEMNLPDLVNPAQLLAEAAVKYSLAE